MNTLESVRAKIVEAVPEIVGRRTNRGLPGVLFDAEITLADVLRAMHKATKLTRYYLTLDGGFMRIGTSWVLVQWNLAANLDGQEPEVIEFLFKILCV